MFNILPLTRGTHSLGLLELLTSNDPQTGSLNPTSRCQEGWSPFQRVQGDFVSLCTAQLLVSSPPPAAAQLFYHHMTLSRLALPLSKVTINAT